MRIPMIAMALCLFFSSNSSSALSDENDFKARVRKAADSAVKSGIGPALVVGVIEGGQLSFRVASGLRRSDESTNPASVNDKVHLGSCGKAMTATLIGVLIDEGRLTWDTTLVDCLPQLRESIDAAYHDVSIIDLLAHRSGVPAAGPFWSNGGIATHENRVGLIQAALEDKPNKDSKPGRFQYSNLGYLIAATMAEEATGEAWEQLITSKMFQPLEMKSAGFGVPDKSQPARHLWGHRSFGTTQTPIAFDNPPSMAPAGCIHCSVSDWSRFIELHVDEDCTSHKLLKPETLQKLQSALTEGPNYFAGWMQRESSSDTPCLWHNGSNTLWYSCVRMSPARDFAVMVVSNGPPDKTEDGVEALSRKVFDWLDAKTRNSEQN